MRRGRARAAEIIRRGDDAAPEVMLPKTIHRDPRRERASAVSEVSHPICKRAAAAGKFRAGWRRGRPALRALGRAREHLEEARRRDAELLIRAAAAEEMRLLEKIRALRVHSHGRVTLGTHEHGHLVARRGLRVRGELRVALAPAGIFAQPPFAERVALRGREARGEVGFLRATKNFGNLSGQFLALQRRFRIGHHGETRAANVVLAVDGELEFHAQRRAVRKIHRLGENENGLMILAELRVDGPAGFGIVVERTGDRKRGFVLLEVRDGARDFHLALGRVAARGARENVNAAQREIAIGRAAGAAVMHRGISKRLETQAGEAALRRGRGEGVVVGRAVRALGEIREVGEFFERRAGLRFRLGKFEHIPHAARGHRRAGREPVVEFRFEIFSVRLQFRDERGARLLPAGAGFADFFRLEFEIDDAAHGRRERRKQAVIILVRNGIVLVLVAARAADREAEERGASGREHVVERVVARALDLVGGDLRGENARAEKAGGGEREGVVRREFVTGELPAEKLIEGQIGVERLDDEVAEVKRADAVVVVLEAGTLGEARDIKPVPRPAFAETRRVEEPIKQARPRVGRAVGQKFRGLLGRGGNAVKIEKRAAEQNVFRGARREREIFRRGLREEKTVDGCGGGRGRSGVGCGGVE